MSRVLLGIVALIAPAMLWASTLTDDDTPLPGRKVGVVLETGPPGAWDADMVESPTVVQHKGRWMMLYTGYRDGVAQIGSAVSDDGQDWHKRGVVLAPRGGEAGVTGPVLVRAGDRWLLYYIGLTEAGYEQGRKSIRLAVSDSPAGPWKRRGMVVRPSGDGWRSEAVWHPSVVRHEGRWFMFFNATGTDERERIGFATAPTPAGPWTVDDERSPVLEPVPGTWESQLVGDPFVRREAGRWVMVYFGYDGGTASDGEAVTTDTAFPVGWERTGRVLEPSEPYDAAMAHKPWIVERGARLWHYYTAVSEGGERRIALVIR